jgi:hypothetical protein
VPQDGLRTVKYRWPGCNERTLWRLWSIQTRSCREI